MEKLYTKAQMKRAFNAGKNCMKDHPDDDSYDKIRFDMIIKKIDDLKTSQPPEDRSCHFHSFRFKD